MIPIHEESLFRQYCDGIPKTRRTMVETTPARNSSARGSSPAPRLPHHYEANLPIAVFDLAPARRNCRDREKGANAEKEPRWRRRSH